MKNIKISWDYLDKFFATISLYYIYTNVGPFFLSKNLLYIGCILIIFLLVYFLSKCKGQRLWNFLDKDIKLVLFFLFLWCFITAFRGILQELSFRGFVLMFVENNRILCYLTPLFLLIPFNECTLKKLKKWGFINLFVFLIINIYFIRIFSAQSEADVVQNSDISIQHYISIAQLLPKGICFLAFYYIAGYFTKYEKRCFCVFLVLAMLAPLLMGRRSAAATVLLIIGLFIIEKIRYNKLYLFAFLFLCYILYSLFVAYETAIENMFPMLFSRLYDDTRTWLENEFYRSFRNDTTGWIFGRGSLGTFQSSEYGNRSLVETGYLDMILHGGILLLISYVYVLFMGFIRGFFMSRNKLINGMALFLLANIFLLYPGGHMALDFQAICIWLSVACCCCRRTRNGIKLM